jgi:hypothetical protein
VSLTTDSNNVLHLFFGERRPGKPDIHGMWHTTFVNGQLAPVDAVVSGPRVEDTSGNQGFDPYGARAVVSQGNVLLVTWQTDPGNIKPNGVWYSYSIVDASELHGQELSAETSAPIVTPIPTPIPPSPIPTLQTNTTLAEQDSLKSPNQTASRSINNILAIGLVPVVLLLSIVLVSIFFISHNNR